MRATRLTGSPGTTEYTTGASPTATAMMASGRPPMTARAPRLRTYRVRLTASTRTSAAIHGGAGTSPDQRWATSRGQPMTAAIARQSRARARASAVTVPSQAQIVADIAHGGSVGMTNAATSPAPVTKRNVGSYVMVPFGATVKLNSATPAPNCCRPGSTD